MKKIGLITLLIAVPVIEEGLGYHEDDIMALVKNGFN